MKAVKRDQKVSYVSPATATLLAELGEECQTVLRLLARLEVAGLSEDKVEDLLGELSAAILHLHEHTRDLDEIIDTNCEGR